MLGRLRDIPGAGLTLRADHCGTLSDASERFAKVGCPTNKGHRVAPLVDVVHVVGGAQNFGLVDVVNLEGLENLGLDKMPNASLRHHRDRHGVDNSLDEIGVAHTSDTTLRTDIGRYTLESHNCDSSGVLGNASLLRGYDVHDDATLQHLSKTALDAGCS